MASTCISVILRWICARVQHGIDKLRSNRFARGSMLNALHERATSHRQINFIAIIVVIILLDAYSSFASTQGLNQIATPDLPPEGDFSISLQAQDQKLGNPYAYDFNETWRVQVDFQSGSGNSSTIGFVWSINEDIQVNPAIYVTNDSPHEVLGYVSFTYSFNLWGGGK